MPEGPEVKIVTDCLNKKLKDKYIHSFIINAGRYKTHGPPKNTNLFLNLLPLKVKSVNAYGKFIWFEFYLTDLTLWNTLGMGGWWTTKDVNHNNISLSYSKTQKLNKNDKIKKINFTDTRNFGTIIFDTKKFLEKKIENLGPDILSTNLASLDRFIKLVKKSKKPLCEILLDQKITAGCGNYLRADAMYLAQLNPFVIGKTLSDNIIKELWNILHQLAWYNYDKNKAIELGILKSNYKKVMPDAYNRIFLIYGQKTDPHNNPVVTVQVKDRTLHWVPKIQTEPMM